jgi:hypothetical protein
MPSMFERDTNTEAHGLATPGIDPRQWVSYATVDPDTPDARSVLYTDPETGNPYPFPIVLCTLQPSGIPIPCRVAASVAGDGESEWNPFVAGDEVLVAIPGGHEREGGVIFARLNQSFDKFPTQVAGSDATKNSFAFRRQRTPYIFETSASYLVRSAGTKAFMSMNQTGAWTIADGQNNMLHIGSDFLALQLGSNDAMVQVNPASGSKKANAFLQGDQAQLLIDSSNTTLLTPGNVSFATAGNLPLEHVRTVEASFDFWNIFLKAAAAAATTPVSLVAFFAAFASPGPLAALITASAAAPLSPDIVAALITALAVPKGPNLPGVGCPGFLVG